MLKKEQDRHENYYHTGLEEVIYWSTKINDARLYWLWTKYFIAASASEKWIGFSNALPLLNTIKPITDTLSWSLVSGRFMMQFLLIRQRHEHANEEKATHVTRLTCLNDFLWGLSNFLSAQWLHSNELRPAIGTRGWWGHLCMAVLLTYDALFVAWQFRQALRQTDDLSGASNEQRLDWSSRKKTLLNALAYTTSLACGFLLFRSFSKSIDRVPAYMGAGLCLISTHLFRTMEWLLVLSKLKNKQQVLTQDRVELQQSQQVFQQTCVAAGASIGLDLLLPLFIWSSSDKHSMLLVIAISLSTNIIINGCYQRDKVSPFISCSVFKRYEPRQIVSVSPEIESPSLV